MAKCTLKGQALADAYAAMINADWGAGKVRAYHTGRMIEISGSGIPCRSDLADLCPNGWTLADKVEPAEARAKLSINNEILKLRTENARMRSALLALSKMEKPVEADEAWSAGFEAALIDVTKLARSGLEDA